MIELITDSTSDLSPDLAAKLGVRVLPLTVHFGEECFRGRRRYFQRRVL